MKILDNINGCEVRKKVAARDIQKTLRLKGISDREARENKHSIMIETLLRMHLTGKFEDPDRIDLIDIELDCTITRKKLEDYIKTLNELWFELVINRVFNTP